jgi:hypothetical protein
MPYTYAPFGRKFCDSPPALLELVLKHLQEEVGEIDLILSAGDWLPHGYDVHAGNVKSATE